VMVTPRDSILSYTRNMDSLASLKPFFICLPSSRET
jgi:hypothetical protein